MTTKTERPRRFSFRHKAKRIKRGPIGHVVARFGLGSRAIIYLTLAALMADLAITGHNRETDQGGALHDLGATDLGTVLLVVFAIGSVCYTAWRWSETAFGAVARPNHRNTPWDQARFEIPVHRWADLSEPGYGVSLLNNGKYGYSAHGNVLGISLLRGPIYPDPYADEGEHEFVYAVYPHAGDWRNGTIREAEEMHTPLKVVPTSGSSWPTLFRLSDESLRLASLKKAEDSEAIILRLYEPHGGRGKTTIETAIPFQKAVIVNILEDEMHELTIEGERRITFEFKPFQVISLKLSLTGARS